ncbi:sensor histidine kinase N-terminal domain-containing protein [Marinobacter daepoensis]|uniref:histidine kinase n=1 Tax=Marinobacter daepoensis TaxID=262077 RepID=A0ABS3BFX6_9GAMM|nr:histidine kinase dimerization/phospho-acceptor domain-containing protein [Marinobacter daepoensis]MBN7770739.1 sensor histidine kinase N-terminal domain-containing protein [Marinobacter daepoensis]MBY6078600.1 sensor histidine kinase N-terminal domain-containing protein [Marinobacter daepoensis]
MSLQRRLLWLLSTAFLILWLSVAALMYFHLDRQVSQTLDQRLAASATMVAGLLSRQPDILSFPDNNPLLVSPEYEGVACQIQAASGEVLLQTNGVRGQLLGNTRPGFSNREIDDQTWRLYTLKQGDTFITTADRLSERVALANGILLAMVTPFTLALIGGLAVLWWGVRRGLFPLQSLQDQLRHRSPENLEAIQLHNAPQELTPVVNTLNNLFARVASTVAWEKRFANSAAHEFRTPLTAVKTHLQVAGKLTGERQQQALANAETGVQRLQTLTEQLLQLSRLERHGLPEAEFSRVENILSQALEDLSNPSRVRLQDNAPGCNVRVPATLAVMAVRNLIENALKHSDTNCDVIVHRVSENPPPDPPPMLEVMVRDAGSGMPPQQSVENQSVSPESHGLGLAIVNTIVTQCGGSLTPSYNETGGMDWKLWLPLAVQAEPPPPAIY